VALGKAAKPPKKLSPHGLVKGNHIVCFLKQNDLGLFGRRPIRWIALCEQDCHGSSPASSSSFLAVFTAS
jgi:hypothetical protein